MICSVLLIFCSLYWRDVYGSNHDLGTLGPPASPSWMTWVEQLGNSHLASLTSEILRDALGRMRATDHSSKKFEKNVMFKIGAVCSSIQGLFDRMVKIYKERSNVSWIERQDWYYIKSIDLTVSAIGVMQSLLQRIRLEKRLFVEIARQDTEDKLAEYDAMVKKFGKPPAGSSTGEKKDFPYKKLKGGLFVERRSNTWYEDEFDSKYDFDNILSRQNSPNPFMEKKLSEAERETEEVNYTVNLAPKPGERVMSKKPDNVTVNPYSDLYSLLGSGNPRRGANLLKFIPSYSKSTGLEARHRKRNPKQSNEPVQKRTHENPDALHMQNAFRRRSLDDASNPQTSKQPLWRPASDGQSYNNQQLTNNRRSVANKRESTTPTPPVKEETKVFNRGAKSFKQPLWKPGNMDTDMRQILPKNDHVEVSNQKPEETIAKMHQESRRENQMWQRRPNPRRSLDYNDENFNAHLLPYDSKGEAVVKQKSNKNHDELTALMDANRQKNEGQLSKPSRPKQPLWQPGQNRRRSYDKNGEIINEPVRHNKDDQLNQQQQLQNAQSNLNPRNMQSDKKPIKKKPLWQPRHKQPRVYDKNGAVIIDQGTNKNSDRLVQDNANVDLKVERTVKPKQALWKPGPIQQRAYGHNFEALRQINNQNGGSLSGHSDFNRPNPPSQNLRLNPRRSYDYDQNVNAPLLTYNNKGDAAKQMTANNYDELRGQAYGNPRNMQGGRKNKAKPLWEPGQNQKRASL